MSKKSCHHQPLSFPVDRTYGFLHEIDGATGALSPRNMLTALRCNSILASHPSRSVCNLPISGIQQLLNKLRRKLLPWTFQTSDCRQPTALACKLKRALLESVLGTGPSARRIRPGSRDVCRRLEGSTGERQTEALVSYEYGSSK